MVRLRQKHHHEGFFGIGLLNSEDALNIGTLWRSAYILGASFIFTIDRRYKKQSSDVVKAWSKIPLYHYDTFEDLKANLPFSTVIVGVEMSEGAVPLSKYEHPLQAAYLLGGERTGLPPAIRRQCHSTVVLPGNFSLNVAVTGSLVLYDRISKMPSPLPERQPQ